MELNRRRLRVATGMLAALVWMGVATASATANAADNPAVAASAPAMSAPAAPAPAPTPRTSTAGASVRVLGPLPMPGLDRSRTIRVYLPPGYDAGKRRYPVVYMQDGQNLFDDATSYVGEWGVDETMDALAASDGIEAIVVGIDHGDDKRALELSPWTNPHFGQAEGAHYLRFLVETVKPYIDANFRTRPGRDDTAIVGSSLGALESQYALCHYPAVFGKAGLLSPPYDFSAEIFAAGACVQPPANSRVYMVIGGTEGRQHVFNVDMFWRMVALLRTRPAPGTALRAIVRPGARHDEAAWRKEFPEAMRFLFGQPRGAG